MVANRFTAPRRSVPAFLMTLAALLAFVSGSEARTLKVEPPVAATNSALESSAERLSRDGACACDSAWVGSILYTLQLPGTVFTFGDTVRIVLGVTNYGTEPVTYYFDTLCQSWFGVYPDSCGPTIPGCTGTWDVGTSCYQMQSSFAVEPGQTQQFVRDWRQHRNESYPAAPGNYTAWGAVWWPYFDESLLSVRFSIIPYGPKVIQEALDAAAPGDTVLVPPGIYQENLILLAQHNGIVLKTEHGPEETILDGGGRGSAVYARHVDGSTVVEGFTIRNGTEGHTNCGPGGYVGGGFSLLELASLTIRNNIIRDCRSDNGGGVATNWGASAQIEGNLFLHNQATDNGGGVYGHIWSGFP